MVSVDFVQGFNRGVLRGRELAERDAQAAVEVPSVNERLALVEFRLDCFEQALEAQLVINDPLADQLLELGAPTEAAPVEDEGWDVTFTDLTEEEADDIIYYAGAMGYTAPVEE